MIQVSLDPEGLTAGTILFAVHRGYRHYGIYVGGRRVIHYVGGVISPPARIEETTFGEFRRRCPVRAGATPLSAAHAEQILARARSRLGEHGYDLLRNNCEHFAWWCHTGVARSLQVEHLLDYLPGVCALARTMLRPLML